MSIPKGTPIRVTRKRASGLIYEGPERRGMQRRIRRQRSTRGKETEILRHQSKPLSPETMLGQIRDWLLRLRVFVKAETHIDQGFVLENSARIHEIENAILNPKAKLTSEHIGQMHSDIIATLKRHKLNE